MPFSHYYWNQSGNVVESLATFTRYPGNIFSFPNDWLILHLQSHEKANKLMIASLTFKGKLVKYWNFLSPKLTFDYDCQSRHSNADWFALILFPCKCNCSNASGPNLVRQRRAERNWKTEYRSMLISHQRFFVSKERKKCVSFLIFNLFVCILFRLPLLSPFLRSSLRQVLNSISSTVDSVCVLTNLVQIQETLLSHKVCSRRRINGRHWWIWIDALGWSRSVPV